MARNRQSASSVAPRRARWRRVVGLAALSISLLGLTAATAPPAASQEQPEWQATPVEGTLVQGAKSTSGRLAETDPALLDISSSAPRRVVVKLDYDSLVAYRGDVAGLPATSPAVTREPLDLSSSNVDRYEGYIEDVEGEFLEALDAEIPRASTGEPLRVVYGGIPVELPGNQIDTLRTLSGVAAVQPDQPEQPLTDSSPEFIGAPTIYNQLGGSAESGEGVIVGVLDSGAWPEHPSFADNGNLPAPPSKVDGTPRTCDLGDNPLTPAADVFVCTNKLIGAQPFLDTYNAVIGGEVFPDSARDSNGHGTHTASTSAGGPVADANPLGISRGAIHGIAPAAHVSVYKVCGLEGCFPSDSAAAVAQAILDGVRVINFSISGGNDPFGDVVELAFLDAYNAGVLVSASAGNDGPGAGTTNHRSPWVTTVAASTQTRTFQSTVTLNGTGGATATIGGSSITAGIPSPLPVVLASAPPYSNALCTAPAPAGVFAGKIVACERGPGRIAKGFNVLQGGAAGMLLYNATLAETMTDNHFLPAVHLEQPEGAALLAFLAANAGATASFTTGAPTTWQGDVMTAFSSRGPGGDWLKPDVTAPGLQILAGNTPVPDDVAGGPPGNLFQAIAGTSMSSPHVAGSAALLFALHPNWTPGQVKSALETTAISEVVKHDRVSPADPFDMGGGRINLDRAGDPGLTVDETAANYAAAAADPLHRIDLNLPSVNAPTMPGDITTTRTFRNVSAQDLTYQVTTDSPPGADIKVSPKNFTVRPNRTRTLTITISGPALAVGQYFGRINLDHTGGDRDLHLPVAFFRQQGAVTLAQDCAPATIPRNTGRSTCQVSVHNTSLQPAAVDATSNLAQNLRLTSVSGATQTGNRQVTATANLAGRQPDAPTIAPGPTPAGFIPLELFGVAPIPIGDEQALNFNVPAFVYAGATFNRLGVTSNGYAVAGGAAAADIDFAPQTFPNPARPNGVLAPFWTDLDGAGAPGIRAATLTDGVNTWVVIEWSLNVFGTTSNRHFQTWIGINGVEDVTFTYDPAARPADPAGLPFNVGAENADGSAGDQIAGLPTEDLRVTSTPGAPGGTLSYSFELLGQQAGVGNVTTSVTTPLVVGTTTEVDPITVQ